MIAANLKTLEALRRIATIAAWRQVVKGFLGAMARR
jgi:hypothetical protein